MNIKDQDGEDVPDEKTIKTTIPGDLYLKLHSVKLLTGKQIKEQVTDALEAHFENDDTLPEASP